MISIMKYKKVLLPIPIIVMVFGLMNNLEDEFNDIIIIECCLN